MSRYTSYGTCALCGKRTTKAGMTRHFGSCPAGHEPSRGKAAQLFWLRIEDAYSPIFWMDMEMKTDAALEELDDFLRRTWLECCGHLSAFYVGEETYTPSYAMEPGLFGDFGERSMESGLGEVLGKGGIFRHVYDFGTTTELKLRVVDERQGRIGSGPLRLLSRNEAPA